MDPTPTTSIIKRNRAKAPIVPTELVSKPTLTTRTPRKQAVVRATLESPTTPMQIKLSTEQLTAMVSTAAYYLAVERNFAPGHEIEDWLIAERQVLAGLT